MWEFIGQNKSPYDKLREEFPDGNMYCWDWFGDYSLSKSLMYLVPFSIVFVNWISKTILRVMTKYYGYQSIPEEVYASTINMFMISFINSGVVIQLVYFDWLPNTKLPLLLAEYDEFSQEWYQEVGVTIVITLLTMAITSPLSNLVFGIIGGISRCWDRGCTFNSKKTK